MSFLKTLLVIFVAYQMLNLGLASALPMFGVTSLTLWGWEITPSAGSAIVMIVVAGLALYLLDRNTPDKARQSAFGSKGPRWWWPGGRKE